MAINWQKGTLFAAGLAVGVAAGIWGVMSLKDGKQAGARPAAASEAHAMGAPAASASTVLVAAPAGTCEQSPILAKGDDGDGREALLSKGGTSTAGEVAAMILGGKEAAASGHPRDAEVNFLNACRQASGLADKERIALADAMYQLGRHYANVAALGAPKSKELYERAERLYSASLEAYTARYGATHEKTKFAQGGLTTVLQATNGSGVAAFPKAAPAPVVVQAPPPVAAPAPVAAAAPQPAAQAASAAAVAPPSGAAAAPTVIAPAPAAPVPRRNSPSYERRREPSVAAVAPDRTRPAESRSLEADGQPRANENQARVIESPARVRDTEPRAAETRPVAPASVAEPPVAQAAPRPAAPPRPRAPVREEPSESSAPPGVASGDSGLAPEPAPLRPRRARESEGETTSRAEGSPNASE